MTELQPNMRLLELLGPEIKCPYPPVSTVTFYKGSSSHCADARENVLEVLRERIQAILVANTWLAGEFRREGRGKGQMEVEKKGGRKGKGKLQFFAPKSKQGLDVNKHLQVLELEGLRPDLDSNVLGSVCEPALVRPHKKMKRGDPLFRVTVANAGSDHIALIMSISHGIADGSTFYAIYGMLDQASKVLAMNPVREMESIDASRAATGRGKNAFLESVPFVIGCATNKLLRPQPQKCVRSVNLDWLEDQKKKEAAEAKVKSVTTNDVLTSFFLQNCGATWGVMTINFRNRLLDLTMQHAGNYEGALMFWCEEASTVGIRAAAGNSKKTSSPNLQAPREDVPGALAAMKGGALGMVTNWAGLYADVRLPGVEQVLHLPVPSKASGMPYTARCVIFRPTSTTLGATIAIHDKTKLKALLDSPAFGSELIPATPPTAAVVDLAMFVLRQIARIALITPIYLLYLLVILKRELRI
jgi:hypothetical protein